MIIFFEVSVVAIVVAVLITAIITAQMISSVAGVVAIVLCVIYGSYVIAASIKLVTIDKYTACAILVNLTRAFPTAIFIYAMISAIGTICEDFNIMAMIGTAVVVPVSILILLGLEGIALYAFSLCMEEDFWYAVLGTLIIAADSAGFWLLLYFFISLGKK